ncbi:hypothetical protein ACOMHN_056278 [Nucella lapillus]
MNNSSVAPVPEGCVTRQVFHFVPWDNDNNVVPKEVDNIINFTLNGVCLLLLFVVSFSTNIINMVVFYKHGLKERINACLFTLSLVDLLSIAMTFGFCSDVMYMYVSGQGGQLGPSARFFISTYLIGLYGLVTSSQIVYSVIAVERCLCITRPLLVKSFMSTKTTVVVLWGTTVVITGGCVLVGGVRYGVVCVFDPTENSVLYVNYPKDLYFKHKFIMDFMYSIVYGLIFPGISFLCVTVCTIITAVELKKLSKWRESVSSASDSVSSRDVAITRVIVATSVLFIACIVPAVLMRTSFLAVPELTLGGRYDNLAWITRRLYIFSSAVNNTFNFFIYYKYGTVKKYTTGTGLVRFIEQIDDRALTTVLYNVSDD